MNATGIEIIGYVSSGLVLVSFLMASVVKLRVVNTIGSFIFAVYALLIRSYPTALMNVCLVLINLYHLYKLRNSEPNYRLLTLDPKDGFLSYFLDSFREDIAKCFPGRDYPVAGQDRAFLVCHGSESAGLLMGRMVDGTLEIALDYTTPAYRDASVGRYLLDHLPDQGLRRLHYRNAEPDHLPFLEKMGYQERGGVWELELKKN